MEQKQYAMIKVGFFLYIYNTFQHLRLMPAQIIFLRTTFADHFISDLLEWGTKENEVPPPPINLSSPACTSKLIRRGGICNATHVVVHTLSPSVLHLGALPSQPLRVGPRDEVEGVHVAVHAHGHAFLQRQRETILKSSLNFLVVTSVR